MARRTKKEKGVLDKVNSPSDLRKLSKEELESLCQEIRDLIIKTVSKTGGHLAPNLGVTELTLGLHLALDSPRDKIVWDVGHQCYIHKIITERKGRFSTLRQHKGLGGFPKKEESPHDVFDSGHASNSISVALGLAEARDIKGEEKVVVAVIGDGSLTGGMAYEALNQAGHLKTQLIVLLNDNDMSIAHNVGAISSYLNRIRLDPAYNKLKEEIEARVRKIPAIGKKMYLVGELLKDSLKQLVVPGMIFEELGFKYVGPIDGHNIFSVKESVEKAKKVKGPVLIHAYTRKGSGYHPAEKSTDKFHGVSPFVISTGKLRKKGRARPYTSIFGDALVEIAKENPKIIAVTAAMTDGTGLKKFSEVFPERFYDVGIAEQHAVTFAAGLSCSGLLPVVAIYSTFLERAYDQIIQDVCLQNLQVVFALDRAGLVGEDGPTHHGAFDLSYLRQIPKMVVMAPKNENELCHMLYTATQYPGPIALRYPRGEALGIELDKDLTQLKIGEAELIKEGKEIVLIAVGRMVQVAREAAEILGEEGVSASVVNARFIKPLDRQLIPRICSQSKLVVTLEENTKVGGFGSGILELLSEEKITVPTLVLGLPDSFVAHGKTEKLLAEVGLTSPQIAEKVYSHFEKLQGKPVSVRTLSDIAPDTLL